MPDPVVVDQKIAEAVANAVRLPPVQLPSDAATWPAIPRLMINYYTTLLNDLREQYYGLNQVYLAVLARYRLLTDELDELRDLSARAGAEVAETISQLQRLRDVLEQCKIDCATNGFPVLFRFLITLPDGATAEVQVPALSLDDATQALYRLYPQLDTFPQYLGRLVLLPDGSYIGAS